MTRPEIRHKRMRVGDLPPEMRRWVDSGDPDEVIDVYEDVSDPIFQRIPRLTAEEDGGVMTRPDIEGMEERSSRECDSMIVCTEDWDALLAYVAKLEAEAVGYQAALNHWLRANFFERKPEVSEPSDEETKRDVDNETGSEPFAGRRYTWEESKRIPPPGYRYEARDDDPGHPTSRTYWVLVRTVS